MWYPTVPHLDMSLNEKSVPWLNRLLKGYKPVIWTHFGGAGGKDLRSLTLIRVLFRKGQGMEGIEFCHGTPFGINQVKKLGKPYRERSDAFLEFAVDGPGGEFINGVDLFYTKYKANMMRRFFSCKVTFTLQFRYLNIILLTTI